MESVLRACEERLLHEDLRDSPALLEEMLADEFEEFGSSGAVSSRAAVLQWLLQKEPEARWEFHEFRVKPLAEGLALAHYVARPAGVPASIKPGSRRTSVWRRHPVTARWQMVFHQATRIA